MTKTFVRRAQNNLDNPLISPDLHTLAQDFLWNAEHVLADSSPFYEKLARRIANDSEILALASYAPRHQPAMNLLFAAVHYLLLRDADDADASSRRMPVRRDMRDDASQLALFYADLTRKPNTQDDPYPIFRAFCLEHADEMIALVRTRRVQTNEVARCALFLPAFTLISQRVDSQPFTLIEVGSSAGLNLNWDRYAYAYGDGSLYGDVASPVRLHCELRGDARPPLPMEGERGDVFIAGEAFWNKKRSLYSRVGIDLNPNDVFDEDAMVWLRALVWPEQLDRAERLQKAIALAREFPPRLLQGDALELAPRVIQETPRETPTVLFHSFVLNQVSDELRARYYELLAENSAERILFDVAIEPSAWPSPLVLTTFRNGERVQETLATCDHHGRWLEWMNHDASV